MNSNDRLLRLFNYDMWANEQILLCLQQHLGFDNSRQSIQYFAHIAGAQELWYRRIKQKPLDDLAVWPEYGLPAALQKLKTLSAQWKQLLNSEALELDDIISYKNSKGMPYDTMLSDILHHVIIHGQHHRAQIAKLLRKADIKPPVTDFIYFCRAN